MMAAGARVLDCPHCGPVVVTGDVDVCPRCTPRTGAAFRRLQRDGARPRNVVTRLVAASWQAARSDLTRVDERSALRRELLAIVEVLE